MWKNFRRPDFACKCGKCENGIQDHFIDKLQLARSLAGVAFVITSGYRCEEHNRKVGGVPKSSHVKGLAADIHCPTSSRRWRIIEALIKAGFKRIGIGETFIHVDKDPHKPMPIMWTYYKD